MDVGAILLDPFHLPHLGALHEAIRDTCILYKLDPARVNVAYGAHGELGERVVLHVHLGSMNDTHEPFLFLTEHDGFGASLSGVLGDKLGEDVPISRAWSVARERRTGFCSVAEGFLYTAESLDSAEDGGPIDRLASRLGVPRNRLLTHLERPDSEWMPVLSPPTLLAVRTLNARLESARLPEVPSRVEPNANLSIYLPEQACREAQELAWKLGLTVGALLFAVWEVSKTAVYEATPVIDNDGQKAPPLPAPDVLPIAWLVVPAEASSTSDLPASTEQVLLEVAADPRMIDEIQILARAADRAQSWVMQKAYVAARARLLLARRP